MDPWRLKLIKYLYTEISSKSAYELNGKKIINEACNQFGGSLFINHKFNSSIEEANHKLLLIKAISNMFMKVVAHHKAKASTLKANAPKLDIRQKFNKMFLFSYL